MRHASAESRQMLLVKLVSTGAHFGGVFVIRGGVKEAGGGLLPGWTVGGSEGLLGCTFLASIFFLRYLSRDFVLSRTGDCQRLRTRLD